MHAAVLDFGTWGTEITLAAGPRGPALQPCSEEPCAKLHQPMAVELPLPLTVNVVAKALEELSQGAATAVESCLECYHNKSISSADLLSFARSMSIHSANFAAVFKAQDPDAQDMGEAAGADDMAQLMSLWGGGTALRTEPKQQRQQPPGLPPRARTEFDKLCGDCLQAGLSSAAPPAAAPPLVAGRTSLASMVSRIESEIVNLNPAVAAFNSKRPQTPADDTGVAHSHWELAASWTFSPLPELTPILEETLEEVNLSSVRRVVWAPVIAATVIIIDDSRTPECGVVRTVPASTLSCLQAVCDAAHAGCARRRPAPIAVPGDAAGEKQKRENNAQALERTESALSAAATPIAHDAPAWERCESDLSSGATAFIDEPVARGTLTLKASASHARSMRAECFIEHRILTFNIDSGVVVEVPLENVGVGLRQGRDNMFMIATVHENKIYDEICCFADDQTKRDEWISIFRQMGVATFDWDRRSRSEKE